MVENVQMLDKRCWGVYWLVETMNVMLLETLMKMLVKKVVVKMLKVVVRGRCDQPECRQPAPILIRPLPADTAPLGHGAHTPTLPPATTCSILLIVVTDAKLSPSICLQHDSRPGPGH